MRDALGQEIRTEYDQRGRRTAVIDALNRRTTFIYDNAGRLLETVHPDDTPSNDSDNPRTRSEYDRLGRKVADIDEAGIRTEYEYDALGNLIAVIQDANGFGYRTEYEYDEQSNQTVQCDALGRETIWEYDDLSRVISRTLPLGQTETMTYDNVGNRIGRVDFNRAISTFQFDNLNRETRAEYADGEVITTIYTANGLMDPVTDSRGITDYTYDERDRITRVEHPNGGVIEYQYDAAGNRVGLITANQAIIYGFDELNRLETVNDGTGTTSYGYNAVGNRAFVNHANLTRTDYAYDERNRLIELTHRDAFGTPFSQQAYTRADTGHKTSLTELDGRVVDYTYDDLYRLMEERVTDSVRGNRITSWTFDAVGNRQTQDDNDIVTSYAYDTNDRLLEENGPDGIVTYSYDENGNTLEQRIDGLIDTSYAYDSQDRLTQADTASATLAYTYDVEGIRQSKTENGVLTEFLVDKNREYAQVIEEANPTGTTVYLRGDDLISQSNAGITSTYHADGQGSTKALSSAAGSPTDRFIYTAYGELEHREGTTASDFLYTGEQFDEGLGFYYLRARYYNPSNGRFPTMDTYQGRTAEPQTLHKYLYVHADPANNIDPSGNFSIGSIGVSLNIQATLRTIAIGSIVGGVIGAADSYFAERDITKGAVQGMIVGGMLGPLTTIRALKPLLSGLAIGGGTYAVYDAAFEKQDFGLAVFRGVTFVAGARAVLLNPRPVQTGDVGVYRSVDSTGRTIYVGITKSFERRAAEHFRSRGIRIQKVRGVSGLSRSNARSVEQVLIEHYGLGKNGGTLTNKINSVSQRNPQYAEHLRTGRKILKRAGFPGI